MRSVRLTSVLVAPLVLGALFSSALPSRAFGLSPPVVVISETLTSASSASESVTIQRGTDETGALTFSVSFHGECDGCIQGGSVLYMASDASSVDYAFTVAPGSVATGEYRQYIAFLIDTVAGDPSGNTVQRGVTATVRFAVEGDSEGEESGGGGSGGGGGGGGGGGSGGRITTVDTPTTEPGASAPTTTDAEPVLGPPEPADPPEATPIPNTDEPPIVSVTEPAFEEEDPEAIGTKPEPTDSASPDAVACPVETSAFDRNADGVTDIADVRSLVSDYVAGTCVGSCDLNGDCLFDLTDIAVIAEAANVSLFAEPGIPPVSAGGPTAEDTTHFYFEDGDVTGSYFFVQTSAGTKEEDRIVIYLLADTGPDGIRAADLSFLYDADAMQLIGVDTTGSIFPFLYGAYGTDGDGSVRIVSATDAPFVGTRGYVAALTFQPLRPGDTSLTFLRVASVGGRLEATPVSAKADDLKGILRVEDPGAVPVEQAEGSTGPSVCPCLRRQFFSICLALLCALVLSGVALLALVMVGRKKRENNLTDELN